MKQEIKFLKEKVDDFIIEEDLIESKGIQIKANSIYLHEQENTKKYYIKLLKDKKELKIAIPEININILKNLINKFKDISPREYYYGLPKKQVFNKFQLYDKQMEDLSYEYLEKEANKALKLANEKKVNVSNANFELNSTIIRTITSNGVDVSRKIVDYGASCELVYQKSGKTSTFYDSIISRTPKSFIPKFDKACDKAIFYIDAKKPKVIPKTVIITPNVLVSLLQYALLPNFNGKQFEKGKTIFNNGNPNFGNVNIQDDGTKKQGINSDYIDFEGTPIQSTSLLSKGKLVNLIYDYNTAVNCKKKPTGNAFFIDLDFNNIIMSHKNAKIKDALVVESVIGEHTANPTTTEFSYQVLHGYIGKTPVKDLMVSGTVIEALNKTYSMSLKKEQKDTLYSGAIATEGVKIIK